MEPRLLKPRLLKPRLIRPGYSWVILASGFLVLFFGTGSRFAFGLVLKPMSEDLGWSRSTLTLGLTAFMLVSAVSLPVVGRLIDRYSLRLVMGVGAVLAALGIIFIFGVRACLRHWHRSHFQPAGGRVDQPVVLPAARRSGQCSHLRGRRRPVGYHRSTFGVSSEHGMAYGVYSLGIRRSGGYGPGGANGGPISSSTSHS